jgi:phosphonate ABC transporter permease subunit PhnE
MVNNNNNEAKPKSSPLQSPPPPSSRDILRRLVVLIGILVGVIIYSTGWRITGINLEETQDETRQQSLQRALSELFSPDLLDQTGDSEVVPIRFMKGCPEDGALDIEQPVVEEDGPYVELSAYCADRDEIVTVQGFGFHSEAIGKVFVVRASGNRQPFVVSGQENTVDSSIFDVSNDGTFTVDVVVPNFRGSEGDIVDLEVRAEWPISAPRPSGTTRDVTIKIIETVFLALMATTLAVPFAFVLSFTAARNLMRQVYLPLGESLVGFILLPVGFLLGALVIGPIGHLGVDLFEQTESEATNWLLTIGAPIGAIVLFAVISRFASQIDLEGEAAHFRGFGLNILLLITVIFVLGAAATFLVQSGTVLMDNEFYNIDIGEVLTLQSADLGLVLKTVGEVVQMTISIFASLGGVFLLASFSTSLTSRLIGKVRGRPSHIMGGVLGVLGGALLMMLTTALGTVAPLLIVIPPVAVTVLGLPLVMRLYDQLVNDGPYKPGENGVGEQTIRVLVQIGAAVIIFVLAASFLDMVQIIARERIPEADNTTLLGITLPVLVVKGGVVGAVLGGIGGAIAGTHSLFPLGMVVYYTSRTTLNALRSIEPLIMGIVFVIWVSAGPFAGMLALGLHSIAALGKLYSEQIESIDTGPIEAIQATGANRLQTIVYAVVPQIIPPYIAFTMYRWDINVRMSTIIGFVGGGGIGFLLQQQINLLRYKQAGVAVLAIAIVVSALDYASASIRERIV